MRNLLLAAALAAVLQASPATNPALAGSVALALDSVPKREISGTFRWADTFIQELEKAGWETETFPKDAIGGEDERLDQVRAGILDMSMSDFGKAVQLQPELRVMQLPYTFKDTDHEYRYFNQSGFLAQMNEKLAAEGVRIIAVVPNGGFLGIFNDEKPVRTTADMSGLRMRALDQSQLEMFQMMGASGVVIPFAEVPNAIQTGIADGYVNAAGVPITFGQADLFEHYTDAKVIISARLALASTAWWDGLGDEEREQVANAAAAASKDVFAWAGEIEADHEAQLREAGIAVYEPTSEELQTFREAVAPMKAKVPNVEQARVDEILADVETYRDE